MAALTTPMKKTHASAALTSVFFAAMIMLIAGLGEPFASETGGLPEGIQVLIDKAYLTQTVEKLQGFGSRRTLEHQWETAKWIHGQLLDAGIDARIDSYVYREQNWPNVIATISGRQIPDRIVMAVAHFDSIADNHQGIEPGADDNATGVAALLGAARVIAQKPNRKTVMLAFFSNEEVSSQGSKYFVQKATDQKLRIEAALNLDILGYNNSRDFCLAEVLGAHRTIKHKLKACYRLMFNSVNRVFRGDNLIKVAGRNSNAGLVRIVAENCAKIEGLQVIPMVRDDCG
jgi:hypothetical protein